MWLGISIHRCMVLGVALVDGRQWRPGGHLVLRVRGSAASSPGRAYCAPGLPWQLPQLTQSSLRPVDTSPDGLCFHSQPRPSAGLAPPPGPWHPRHPGLRAQSPAGVEPRPVRRSRSREASHSQDRPAAAGRVRPQAARGCRQLSLPSPRRQQRRLPPPPLPPPRCPSCCPPQLTSGRGASTSSACCSAGGGGQQQA